MKRTEKIQEWLADRISWVQYPNLRPADERTRAKSRSDGIRFVNEMPWQVRVIGVLAAVVGIAVSLVILGLLLTAGYAFFGAVFGWYVLPD